MDNCKKENSNLSGIIVFEIGKRQYCLDFDEVYDILKFSDYQELSGCPLPGKAGFMLNNKLVHLIQMQDESVFRKITNASRMIIVEVKDCFVAFWADSINEIRLFEKEELKQFKERSRKLTHKDGISLLTGTYSTGDNTFLIPDFYSVDYEILN